MTTTTAPATSRTTTVHRALAVVAGLLVVLILAQASLAGQFLFEGGDIALHGHLGNASFALGVIAAALAAFVRRPAWLLLVTGLLLLALFGQTGLGYVGRESTMAASLHIPLGVTCLGLAVWLLVTTVGLTRRA